MPFALPHSTWIAFTPRTDGVVKLHSIDFNQTAAFSLSSLEKSTGWIEYVKGVAWALQKRGQVLNGFEGIVQSDVPIGAGLSSSAAAIELASLYAFSTSSNFNLQALEAALIAQQAEREWVGTNCGVMDQIIQKKSLRDVSLEDLERASLPDILKRRARHVVSENQRVLQVATGSLDLVKIGYLINESHQSLRNDFEVSSPALDTIVEIAQCEAGCYGARMTGAGFAGCAIALVSREAAERFIQSVEGRYRAAMPLTPAFFIAQASSGATVEAVTSHE